MSLFRDYTKPTWFWPLGLIASGLSFPAMPFRGRAWPEAPAPERVGWETGSIFHNLKNVTTEMYRADPMWWSKLSWMIILVLLAIIVAL